MQRRLVIAGTACLAIGLACYVLLQWTFEPPPLVIHVQWADGVTDGIRPQLERHYSLSHGNRVDGQSWQYQIGDASEANIRELVGDSYVSNTGEIDRSAFRVTRDATVTGEPPSRHPRLSALARTVAATGILIGLALIAFGLLAPTPAEVAAATSITLSPSQPRRKLTAREWGSAATLLVTLAALSVASATHVGVTFDEPNHLRYGRSLLALDSTRFDDSKMPVSAVNAFPGAVAERLPAGPLKRFLAGLVAARFPTIVFSLLIAVVVFAWSRSLYGPTGALLALTLYTFDPNFIAHGQLATTDVYAAGMTLFWLYAFWRFLQVGSPRLAIASALLLGIAQIAKYSLVLLFPLAAAIALVFHMPAIVNEIRERRGRALYSRARHAAAYTVVFAAISLLVINAGFLFNGTMASLSQYAFDSSVFESTRSWIDSVRNAPMPVPVPYLQGLDKVIDHERNGTTFGRLYLMGELRRATRPFTGYYLYASLFKVPLGTLAILLATTVGLIVRRRPAFLRSEALLVLAIAGFTVYFNIVNRAQIGIRYFLVVFPLLYVLSGRLLANGVPTSRAARVGIAGAVVALVASVLSYYPFYLPYFNETIGGRLGAHRFLADSNLDWGQYGPELTRYRAAHPEALMEPEGPVAGTILVRVNSLVGVIGPPAQFAWLRENFRPVDHVAYGVLVYEVSESEIERLVGDKQ